MTKNASRFRTELWSGLDRRQLLIRAFYGLPLLHHGLFSGSVSATTNTPRVDFRELVMQTHRPRQLVEFYRDVIGLPVREGAEVIVSAGETDLVFRPVDDDSEPFYHFALTIPENKLPAAIEWMASRAPLLDRGSGPVVHFEALDAHSVYFYDPAGNIVEFIAHHRLENGRSGAFDSDDILYASEIGMVVPGVTEMVEQLEARLGLGVYVHSFDTFAPVGDIHGLFIVVETARVWLMTDKQGKVFPTEVVLGSTKVDDWKLADLPYRIRSGVEGAE